MSMARVIMRKLKRLITLSLICVILNFVLLYVLRHEQWFFEVQWVSQRKLSNLKQNHLGDDALFSAITKVEDVKTKWKSKFTTGAQIVKQIIFKYPNFNITEPEFVTERHKTMFHLKTSNNDVLGVQSSEKLLGQIYIIRNGSLALPCDCGYKSNVADILQVREVSISRRYRSVVPLIVPDGGTFQHFLDGVLPKIIQSLEYISLSQVRLILTPIRDQIIFEMLAKLNISKSRISFYSGSFSADYFVFTCITPPLHPVLWQKARNLLGASESLQIPENEAKIVIITREGCRNCDRNLLNIEALVSELQAMYSRERVSVFRGPYDLNTTLELFSKTKVVIGTHGGGMYNINFCPKGTAVIEIMPTYSNGKTIAAADTIIWTQSVLLGHQYWRLPTAPVNYLGDVVVNITLVKKLLENSDFKTWGGFVRQEGFHNVYKQEKRLHDVRDSLQ